LNLALSANTRPTVANTLAYCDTKLLTGVKRLIVHALGANPVKYFMIVASRSNLGITVLYTLPY